MKKLIPFLSFAILSSTVVHGQKDKTGIEAAVTGFFNGLSKLIPDSLKHYSTADFLLLENGAVWNLDSLINKMMPMKNSSFTRVNSFEFISTQQKGRTAWVSYWNLAEFSFDGKQQTINWLESAVLVKNRGRWKIRMLHSTKTR